MDEAANELRLVTEAVRSGTTGCVVWKDERLETRVRRDAALQGLTPEGINDILIDFVQGGGRIHQKRETRDDWKGLSEYVYEVSIELPDFSRDLFIELVLSDPVDEDCPVAVIVSAHLSSFERRKR